MIGFRRWRAALAVLFCSAAANAHDFEVDGIYYNITSSESPLTVEVTYEGDGDPYDNDEYGGKLSIPESVTYDGKSYSVTGIGYGAFWRCKRLTEVVLPGSVGHIKNDAFRECSTLTTVTIPSSVTKIGEGVFHQCPELIRLTVDEGNTVYDSRGNCNAIIETSSNTLIYGCRTTLIPNTVTGIGKEAFFKCTRLTKIVIPASVTSIGVHAFSQCFALKSIVIPDFVTTIGEYAFYRCSDLTSITIGKSVKNIESTTFAQCPYLTSIVVNEGNVHYDSRDNCNAIIETASNTLVRGCHSTVIPSTVTGIGDEAFTAIYGVYLEGDAVKDCSDYNGIVIPNSVTRIGHFAFAGCKGLKNLDIPNSVIYIGKGAFSGCTKLESITIPNSVTSIEEATFESCFSLPNITIPASVTSIGDNAFLDCRSLANITVESGNAVYDSRGNCNAIIETASNTLIQGSSSTVIPGSVTSIGKNAFYGNLGLTVVDIPSSVTSIGESAFYKCKSLVSVTIPESVTRIERGTFYECSSLLSFTVPKSITYIGDWAFAYCFKLKTVINYSDLEIVRDEMSHGWIAAYAVQVITDADQIVGDFCFSTDEEGNHTLINYIWDGHKTEVALPENYKGEKYAIGDGAFVNLSALKSITLTDAVTSIGYGAFESCTGIEEIAIPTSVTLIKNRAFYNCKGIKAVHITDLDAWCKIKFEEYTSNPLTYAQHLYLNGEEITRLVIPDTTTSIGGWAFGYCSSITDVVIPNSVTFVDGALFFGCSSLTNVSIGNSVTHIGGWAFANCKSLEEITIPESVDTLGVNFFNNCTALKRVTLSNKMKYISPATFNGCESLKEVRMPESLVYIEGNAFSGCESLENIVIPSSVVSISSGAFANCTSLSRIVSLATVPPGCVSSTFRGVNKETCILQVPTGSKTAYQAAEVWKDFLIVEEGAEGMDELLTDTPDQPAVVDVYTLQGVRVKANVPAKEATLGLPGGIYIIGNKKVVVK